MTRWAPRHIPLSRRLQTAAVAGILSFPLLLLVATTVACYYSNWVRWGLLVLHPAWLLLDRSPKRGGRPWQAFRNSRVAAAVRAYFPARLLSTGRSLPTPSIICVHPHGVVSAGVITNLVLNNAPNAALLGDYRVATVSINFMLPIWREFILAAGFIDASRESVGHCLTNGHNVVIVVGGAAEALDAYPGSTDLTLARRTGFVRLALQHGASLVPGYSFGETDLYERMEAAEGSWVRRAQLAVLHYFGFTIPYVHGRGIFSYDFGFLPRRVALNTVLGDPIPMPKLEDPSEADVARYHAVYCAALEATFNAHCKELHHPTDFQGRPIEARRLNIVR